ncbi:hypothetical protein AB3N02_22635 [Priestia aryabhattai]|uniref:hypothetical protein n=1 Tax=Priestia aryabhattai TaxID=412384 RepID=UPI0039A3F393
MDKDFFIRESKSHNVKDMADKIETLFSEQIKGLDGKKYKIVAGVIRNDGTGWKPIIDANHQGDLNVGSVTNDNSAITVNFSGATVKKIIGFVAVPDETYAWRGVTFGSSVGKTSAIIYPVRNGRSIGGYISYDGTNWVVATGATGNIAVTGFNTGTGELTVTHDDMGDAHVMSVSGRDGSRPSLGSSNQTTTVIKFYDASGTIITTPTTALKVFLSRGAGVRQLNPNTLTEASGNIWFMGIFEV